MRTLSTRKILFVIIVITAAAAYWFSDGKKESKTGQYKTRVVERGDIVQTISANGTLTPVVLVNVGTQVSGTVSKLYVDFNDKVKKGQALLELDDALVSAT